MEHNNKQRWLYLDICKIFAIFLVCVLNVSSYPWSKAVLGSFEWNTLNLFNSLSRICIPLFIMQTGALFLNESRELPIKTLFTRYIIPIVTAFLFWSLLYTLNQYRVNEGNFASIDALDFVDRLLKGAPYSQTFVLRIVAMYVIVPVLRPLARDRRACLYFVALWFVASAFGPFLYNLPYIVSGTPDTVRRICFMLADAINRLSSEPLLGYAGFMLLGHLIHTKEFTRTETLVGVVLGLAGFVYTVMITTVMSMRGGASTERYFAHNSVNIVLCSIGVMMLSKAIFRNTWFEGRLYKGFRFFSDVSFGIFLLHDFIRLMLSSYLRFDAFLFTPILSVPAVSIVTFVVSACLAFALRKIPKVGRFLV